MIEQVAKALKYHLAFQGDKSEEDWIDAARGAIEAMREPTEAMKNATYMRDWEALEIWEAMISAALPEQN